MNKKELGQFYTTNAAYIVGNLLKYFPKKCTVIDPFAGNWDLLNLLKDSISLKIEAFDKDPQNTETIMQDTLLNPPSYKNKFVYTNPPYLAKNKTKNQEIFSEYEDKYNDLYKIAIKTLIDGEIQGGVLVVPLNFFSDQRANLRTEFLSNYLVEKLNIFEEKVFDDTDYTVCSFFFRKKSSTNQELKIKLFPSNQYKRFVVSQEYNFQIAGKELQSINRTKNQVIRLVEKAPLPKGYSPTNLVLRAIDSGAESGDIKLFIDKQPFLGKDSSRTFAGIALPSDISSKLEYEKVCELFNTELNQLREKYHSLFLTNYRNSSSYRARKRISFKLAFKLLSKIITNENT